MKLIQANFCSFPRSLTTSASNTICFAITGFHHDSDDDEFISLQIANVFWHMVINIIEKISW